MDEPQRKKTMLAWQPPAAAGDARDPTLLGLGESQPVPAPAPAAAVQAESPADMHAQTQPAQALQGSIPVANQVQSGTREVVPQRVSHAPLGPGEVIGGRYVIKELAGEGGFAAVYRAADSQIPNHEVAVKVLRTEANDEATKAAALRELTLIASVSHPSVVQFKDYGWHEGRLFFAMPWYRGRTLATVIPLDRASARRVFERCAYGLQAMHDAGICHYDIKPDNIFLADIAGFEAGFPVLLDLGIAAKRGETPMALTPEYASPETALAILNGGQTPVGTAADIFSLALALRNTLEPESAPELGESLPAFLHKRTIEPVEPPKRKEFAYLQPLFKKWLSIEPSDRPTAAEFAVQLAALTQPEEERAERKRLLLRAAPIVLLLMLVAGGLALALRHKSEELVLQKKNEAREDAEMQARFDDLKKNSQNQLDAKLQLAQELLLQRDDFRKQRDDFKLQLGQTRSQLESTAADRNRVRADLKSRTTDLEETRTTLQTTNQTLQQTRADLAQRSHELDVRQSQLDDTRAQLSARTQELAARTEERERAQADLARRAQELQVASRKLDTTREDLDARTRERDKAQSTLDQREKELDRARDQLRQLNEDLQRRTKELDAARKAEKSAELSAAKAEAAAASAPSPSAEPGTAPKKKKAKPRPTAP
ncbi:MAG TPA: protein kinase [Polyangiales bacterium]|jgi:serine/threonine protein kinase|nr:protein kinase [Polyangiales bacterium]